MGDMVHFRRQIAALPWRMHKGRIEVLLITSRETKRWVIPKGWPLEGRTLLTAARAEAFEEAGVTGRMNREPIGTYDYVKRDSRGDQDCSVTVFALEVQEELKKWPERRQRDRRWFDAATAEGLVAESGLQDLIRNFVPPRR